MQIWSEDGIMVTGMNQTRHIPLTNKQQGPLLLTWFNFNPSMDK